MIRPKRIICTVTSDPAYDQRMIRICTALQNVGYEVTLLGRRRPNSPPLPQQPFRQKRLDMRWLDQGKLFYLVYWTRLFFYLLFAKADALCAIDLDTILPVYWVSRIRGLRRVYDAHELFTEIEEVVSRPRLQKLWLWIERHTVPHFKWGYTIGACYAAEFKQRYDVDYAIVRNATVLAPLLPLPVNNGYVLYQGAVNRGRCFEELIPAMQTVRGKLLICGEGNFMAEARALVTRYKLEEKIEFRGYVPPAELRAITRGAAVGLTLFWAKSLSNEYSLANRFFDYLHAGVPQLAGAYPEYKAINGAYEVALLLPVITTESIAEALNELLTDTDYASRLSQNALVAREVYNWQAEEIRLLEVWKNVFTL